MPHARPLKLRCTREPRFESYGELACAGITVRLAARPHVPGLAAFEALSWLPGHVESTLQDAHGLRPLTEPEHALIGAWLQRFGHSVHRAYCGHGQPYAGPERRLQPR